MKSLELDRYIFALSDFEFQQLNQTAVVRTST